MTEKTNTPVKADQTKDISIFGGGDTRSKAVIDEAKGKALTAAKNASDVKLEPEKNDTTNVTDDLKKPETQVDQYALLIFEPQNGMILVFADAITEQLSRTRFRWFLPSLRRSTNTMISSFS